ARIASEGDADDFVVVDRVHDRFPDRLVVEGRRVLVHVDPQATGGGTVGRVERGHRDAWLALEVVNGGRAHICEGCSGDRSRLQVLDLSLRRALVVDLDGRLRRLEDVVPRFGSGRGL